jgi:hypothetical protein
MCPVYGSFLDIKQSLSIFPEKAVVAALVFEVMIIFFCYGWCLVVETQRPARANHLSPAATPRDRLPSGIFAP